MSAKVPLSRQIAEVERELRLRRDAYPRLVASGKMRQSVADFHTGDMAAAKGTLEWLQEIGEDDLREFVRAKKAKREEGSS